MEAKKVEQFNKCIEEEKKHENQKYQLVNKI